MAQPMKNGMRQPQLEAASGAIQVGDRIAEQRGEHDRDLLARRLPADVEALVPGRRHLRQIDRDAAEFDAGRKPLQEPPQHHQHRGEHADGRVARHEGDEDCAAGHDRERENKAFAPADAVDVRPEHQRADRTHRKPRRETQESRHQRGVRVVAGEEGLPNLPGVNAEQKEVIHFEEIAAGDAQNGLDSVEPCFAHRIPPSARLLRMKLRLNGSVATICSPNAPQRGQPPRRSRMRPVTDSRPSAPPSRSSRRQRRRPGASSA